MSRIWGLLIGLFLLVPACIYFYDIRFDLAEDLQVHFDRNLRIKDKGTALGTYGDYIGGVYGTILSLLTVLFLIFNYFSERRRHEENLLELQTKHEINLKAEEARHTGSINISVKQYEESATREALMQKRERIKAEYLRVMDMLFRQVELTHNQIDNLLFVDNQKNAYKSAIEYGRKFNFNHLQDIYIEDFAYENLVMNFDSIYHASYFINTSVTLIENSLSKAYMDEAQRNELRFILKSNLKSKVIGLYEVLKPKMIYFKTRIEDRWKDDPFDPTIHFEEFRVATNYFITVDKIEW